MIARSASGEYWLYARRSVASVEVDLLSQVRDRQLRPAAVERRETPDQRLDQRRPVIVVPGRDRQPLGDAQ